MAAAQMVYFTLSWKIQQTGPGCWIGVCQDAALLVDGSSKENVAERTHQMAQFMVDTFYTSLGEQELRDYFDKHGIEWELGPESMTESWLEVKERHGVLVS